MARKESACAAKLRELGFVLFPSKDISRAMRRDMIARGTIMQFSRLMSAVEGPVTLASDEYAFLWKAAGFHDLTALGFIDVTEGVEEDLRSRGIEPLEKPRYH